MAASTGNSVPAPVRVLCLGNDLVADDGLGAMAARRLRGRLASLGARAAPQPGFDPAATAHAFAHPRAGVVEVVETALTGMYLLDAVVGARRLVVIDTIVTGNDPPGTVRVLDESDFSGPRGASPHYVGLLEALDLARSLGLGAPEEVAIVAVEAGDYLTIGGEMTEPVAAAVPTVVEKALALIE